MLLTIRSLTKTFPGTLALDDVRFDLAAGEVHALLGENGAGKSTLIKCLTGAYRPDAGEITLDGAVVAPRSTGEAQELGIGTVYQEVNLLPNLTVAQNLCFGREPRRFGLVSSRGMKAMAEGMLDGSDAISDWALLNAMVNVASGASWVSFHHGGGVGIGFSQHAGQVIVADGSPEASKRLARVLRNDPMMGIFRHADAGYDTAKACAQDQNVDIPMGTKS